MKNADIYFSRLTSALCLFLILAGSNLWLDPVNNTILVLGYRLFILLTPLLFLFFKHRLTIIAFILAECGLFLWLKEHVFYGVLLFSIGISVSGYMLKYYSSFSTAGAANNKIAINLGSIFSGVLIAFSQDQRYLILFCMLIMMLSFFSFFLHYKRENISNFKSLATHFQFRKIFTPIGLAWGLIGFVIGVKLIAVVSILPQFLIQANKGELPSWFGVMLIFNSLVVVLFQIPVMGKIKNFSAITALFPLFLGMTIIMFSAYLGIISFVGALVWTILLSLVECTISYLDKLAQDDSSLLVKEACVGIGCAATVYFVRFFSPEDGSFFVGLLAVVLLCIASSILYLCSKVQYPFDVKST